MTTGNIYEVYTEKGWETRIKAENEKLALDKARRMFPNSGYVSVSLKTWYCPDCGY